jgi:hypothetical protein
MRGINLMQHHNSYMLLLAVFGILFNGFSSWAQEPVMQLNANSPSILASQPQPQLAPFEKVSSEEYRLGEIIINKKERSIIFPAMINMQNGLLEYLLVRTGGKTHESLLRTGVDPYQLQLAFLLLGYQGTDKPLSFQGDTGTPKGEPVIISLYSAATTDKKNLLKPEEWLTKKNPMTNAQQDVGSLNWVFTGSMVLDGRFMAQADGSMIALYHDPAALVDNASPGGESDKVWFVREGAVPPVGTAVTVTIRPRK